MSAIAGAVYATPSFMPLSLQARLVPPQGHPSLCHRDWASHQPFHLWPAKANKNATKGRWQAKKTRTPCFCYKDIEFRCFLFMKDNLGTTHGCIHCSE